jgi:hypothetical protein
MVVPEGWNGIARVAAHPGSDAIVSSGFSVREVGAVTNACSVSLLVIVRPAIPSRWSSNGVPPFGQSRPRPHHRPAAFPLPGQSPEAGHDSIVPGLNAQIGVPGVPVFLDARNQQKRAFFWNTGGNTRALEGVPGWRSPLAPTRYRQKAECPELSREGRDDSVALGPASASWLCDWDWRWRRCPQGIQDATHHGRLQQLNHIRTTRAKESATVSSVARSDHAATVSPTRAVP